MAALVRTQVVEPRLPAHRPRYDSSHRAVDYLAGFAMVAGMSPARELEVSASGGSAHSVLVVEDEVLIRLAVADYLRDCGYQVYEAANASEAKALLNTLPIDLVFSDVNMPGENGLALAEWTMLRHPAIPIVLTSGENRLCESKLPTHTAILPKPYHFGDLKRLMQSLLRKAETGG